MRFQLYARPSKGQPSSSPRSATESKRFARLPPGLLGARVVPKNVETSGSRCDIEIHEFPAPQRPRPLTPARFGLAWAINALGLWVANGLFSGVWIHGWTAYLVGAAVLGIANAVLKPVLAILTLPLILVTLGFFLLVINVAMVALAAWITPNFSVHGFWTYVGVVTILWIVNWAGNAFVDRTVRDVRSR
jgi:putative membrane protein